MAEPNPVRTLKSHAVIDQTDPQSSICERADVPHRMQSIKTNSEMVPYVEQCANCSWVDGASLNWWGHEILKRALSERAGRIAVAAETEPFAFVQSSHEDLTIEEVLGQALGAASMCWMEIRKIEGLEFDSTRAKAIYEALIREVSRFHRLDLEDAASRAVDSVKDLLPERWIGAEETLLNIRKAVEGRK